MFLGIVPTPVVSTDNMLIKKSGRTTSLIFNILITKYDRVDPKFFVKDNSADHGLSIMNRTQSR